MLLHEFYEHILPPSGNYCIFRTSTRQHEWATSIAGLVSLTESYPDQSDVYFATATFDEPTSRTQVNADLKKSFYLDLDAGATKLEKHGADKVYTDKRAALADVLRFAEESGLDPTLVVSSGEGLHIYWELTEAIPAANWTPIAKRFQKYGASFELKIDSAVTADSARILRPIDTFHPNGKKVKLLQDTGRKYTIEEFSAAIGADTLDTAPAPRFNLDVNDDIGPAASGPPKTIKKVLQNCAAALYAGRNQATIEEPYWRAMIGLAKHTLEGIDAAHALSNRHPKYNAKQTEDYFDRWSTGPTTCEKFGEFNKAACKGCKFKGKIKSPIVLGALNVEEVEKLPEELQPAPVVAVAKGNPWDGAIPDGFDVVTKKGINTLVHFFDTERENELGEMVPVRLTIPVTNEIFWLSHWADPSNEDDIAQASIFLVEYGGNISHHTLDQGDVPSVSELLKSLARKGIHASTDKRAPVSMQTYVKAQLQRIKPLERKPKIRERFGLTYLPDGKFVSAHGKYVIYDNGMVVEARLTNKLRPTQDNYCAPFPPNADGIWQPAVWKETIMPAARAFIREHIEVSYNHKGLEKYQLSFWLGAASPLMAFTTGGYARGPRLPGVGYTVSLYSKESGRGKTALMRNIALVWGAPAANTDRNKAGATEIGRISELSLRGTMPSLMDEMGSITPAQANTVISLIGNGAGRIRATRDGGVTQAEPWAFINFMGSNVSIREMTAQDNCDTNAVTNRMLELNVDAVPEFEIEDRTIYKKRVSRMMEIGGALGAVIELLIIKHGSEYITELVNTKTEQASKMNGSKQSERFHESVMGCLLALHELLQPLGLWCFDINVLAEEFRVSTILANEFTEGINISTNNTELLSKMLADFQGNTVVTLEETRRTAAVTKYDVPLGNRTVPDPLYVRHILKEGISYVSVDAMKKWCVDHKVRPVDLLSQARQIGVLRHVYPSDVSRGKGKQVVWASPFNLTKGMDVSAGGQVRVYSFNVRRLAEVIGVDYGDVVLRAVDGSDAPAEESVTGEATA